MKKVLCMLLAVFTLIQGLCVTSFAEDVNNFPPVRPTVGNMTIAVGGDNSVVGVRTNGTVNINSSYITGKSKNEFLGLTNIVDVATTGLEAFALRSDGTVYAEDNKFAFTHEKTDFSTWKDIVDIDCGTDFVVGLKSDGTVVALGIVGDGQCNVMGWSNVSKIYAHNRATFGIRKDGSVLATGQIDNYSSLAKLKNVNQIYCIRGKEYGALLNDGTVTDKRSVLATDEKLQTKRGYQEGFSVMELSIDEIFRRAGYQNKIVGIGTAEPYERDYFILDDAGDLYHMYFEDLVCFIEKEEEKILFFVMCDGNYYALDENGQIWSNAAAFTSDDWILTTNITYNGEKINSDVPPYVKEGRTLAPIRAILEALGMIVSWDGTTQTATAIKGDITISVTINSNIAIVNGIQKTLDVPAEITNGRTFVPVRFFAEALNMNVDWDGYTKTVIIESK